MSACNHDEGPGHDCAYVDWRNSLIPVAEAVADATVTVDEGACSVVERGRASERWDRVFHEIMDRLAAGGEVSS